MTLRNKYAILYILSYLVPIILFVVGIFFNLAAAKDKLSNFYLLFLLIPILIFVSAFIVNFWYGSKLGVSAPYKILAGFFNVLGFLFLMGYKPDFISAKEIVLKSCENYKKNWKLLWPYLLALLLPTIVFSLVSILSAYLQKISIMNTAIIFAVFIASLIFTLWISIALAQTTKALLNNEPVKKFQEVLSANSKYIGSVIWVSILVALIVIGGTLLLIVPGVIFSIWYAFAFYAVIFENKTGGGALQASKNMVAGRWWEIVWRIAGPAFFFSLLVLFAQWILYWPARLVFPSAFAFNTIWGLISSILNTLVIPLSTAASVILYVNAKKTEPTLEK